MWSSTLSTFCLHWPLLLTWDNLKKTLNIIQSFQIMPLKLFLWWWRHRWRHRVPSSFLHIHVYEKLAPGASCMGNVSSINANIIIIVLLGYTCHKTVSMNDTFRDCRSKVIITGLLGDLGTNTAVTQSLLGLSRWNKNWNVRNSYSYVATATQLRFHLQFPWSPDCTFGGLIGWFFNWKCKFSCRIISNIANYLKCNYFWDGR